MFPKTATNLRFAGICLSAFAAVGLTLAYFQKGHQQKSENIRPAEELLPIRVTIAKKINGKTWKESTGPLGESITTAKTNKHTFAIDFLPVVHQAKEFDFTLTNTTNRTIHFSLSLSFPISNWQIVSRDKSVSFPGVFGGSTFYATTKLHPGESKTFTHVLSREYSKRNTPTKFHVTFHPVLLFKWPQPRNIPLNIQMTLADVNKILDRNIKEEMRDRAEAERLQNIAWKSDPLNRDFVSNEIEF